MKNQDESQQDLVLRATAGERGAFDALMLINRGKLRGLIRRMVGHAQDTEDLVQESMLRAWEGIASFRGDASFASWLCAIGARQALDHLRRQKSWRAQAQVIYANECFSSQPLQDEVIAVISDPEFAYQAEEHIAYCFCCLGRSLPAEQQAALVLRDVEGLGNREAAKALGLSESVLRHHLGAARAAMQQQFEGLCSLVSKQGVCYQCKGLREVTPRERQGVEIPEVATLDQRIDVVRSANIDRGASQSMHDLFWRRTAELEACGGGSTTLASDCGQ